MRLPPLFDRFDQSRDQSAHQYEGQRDRARHDNGVDEGIDEKGGERLHGESIDVYGDLRYRVLP